MLASHNILNPANGSPSNGSFSGYGSGTLLYDQSLENPTKEVPVKGEGLTFYS